MVWRPFLVVLMALAAVVGVRAQTSSLVLLAAPGDYPGETYTAGPTAPAEYVYFAGEPVAIDVSIANWGSNSLAVDLTKDPVPRVELTFLDGKPKVLRAAALDGVWYDSVGGSLSIAAEPVHTLEPGDSLRWQALLDGAQLESGFYRVQASSGAVDAYGTPVRMQRAAFVLEVRSRPEAEPAELARRVAEWLAARGTPGEAWAATEDLARVYPDSVAVHLIRSRLADAAGDASRARLELDVAEGFMRTDRDTLFRRFARPGQIEDLVESLRR